MSSQSGLKTSSLSVRVDRNPMGFQDGWPNWVTEFNPDWKLTSDVPDPDDQGVKTSVHRRDSDWGQEWEAEAETEAEAELTY
jgi:hypothetical protein